MSRKLLRALVQERLVILVIIANTTVLMLAGFPSLSHIKPFLFWADYVFTTYFIAELIIKIRLNGFAEFWSRSWNRFDLLVVIAGSPVLLEPLINTEHFSFVLIFRTARLLRLMRGFRFIPDSEKLWSGVQRALRASVGVFLALLIYNLILSYGAHALFGRAAPEYFRDPAVSMYSMFKVFTIEGWFEIPDAIAARSGTTLAIVARLYFVAAVITGGLLGLSLANAVFVDEMVIDNTGDLEEQIRELQQRLDGNSTHQASEIKLLHSKLDQLLKRVDVHTTAAAPESTPPTDKA